jgi:hypothetical protein
MIVGVAVDSRFMRSMLEVIRQDYIRTAKAKGLSRRSVIFKHAFRNALLPIITNIGLFAGADRWRGYHRDDLQLGGLGYQYITAITEQDYPIIQALSMVSALAVPHREFADGSGLRLLIRAFDSTRSERTFRHDGSRAQRTGGSFGSSAYSPRRSVSGRAEPDERDRGFDHSAQPGQLIWRRFRA